MGNSDGTGTAVGEGIGSLVGFGTGNAVGTGNGKPVGCGIGTAVGEGMGTFEGCGKGTAVGDRMGTLEGWGTGTGVGDGFGTLEGLGTGTLVGSTASRRFSMLKRASSSRSSRGGTSSGSEANIGKRVKANTSEIAANATTASRRISFISTLVNQQRAIGESSNPNVGGRSHA